MRTKCLLVGVVALFILGMLADSSHAKIDQETIIGIWLFDEEGGDVAKDSSGNGNDGTLFPPSNGPQWTSESKFGGALEFNGAGTYVEFATGEGMKTPQFTIMAWFKTRKLNGYGHIFQTGNDWNDMAGYVFRVNNNGNAQSGLAFGPANDTTFVTGPALEGGTWYHMALTYDGTTATLYLDGNTVASNAGNGEIMYDDQPVRIGVHSNDTGSAFDGFIDEVSLFDVALEAEDIQTIMDTGLAEITAGSAEASNPLPANGQIDVQRDGVLSWTPGVFSDTHNVHFGTAIDDVTDASTSDPRGVLVGQGLIDASIDPGRLAFSQTYYWRVDEVNAAPDFTEYKGEIWSFTVEPFSIPISNITATASSSFGLSGPEKTIDGSGLVDDLHGTSAADMWISGGIPATLEYTFDKVYKLHELWIWNSNQLIEAFVGFGAKEVVIEHSLNGENWTVLDGVGPLAQGPGTAGYAHNNTIDLGGAAARHVRVTVNSVQGIAPQASLSEIRFFYIPTAATRPSPESGASGVSPDVTLSWGRDGREADRHEIYLGTDAADLPLVDSASESSFDTLALDLQLGQTFFWRVDEVNDATDPSVWSSDTWSFTTTGTILVDDMESYEDAEFLEIWATWVDGFDDPSNGSLVGADPAIGDFAPETGIVHGGSQSLPIWFDSGAAAFSEATRTFDQTQDWSRSGVQTLVLSFLRGAGNTGNGVLYVKINGTKVVYQEDASSLPPGWDVWTRWGIDLTGLGVDLSRVRRLTIGMEGAGKGVLYVDDIHLTGDTVVESPQVLSWFEAESGTITAPLQIFADDPTASGGQYIGTADGSGDENDNPPADGRATYPITVPEDGVYSLAFRTIVAGGNDSFWVRIAGMVTNTANHASGWIRFNEIQGGDTWQWDEVHSNDDGNQVVEFTLSAGTHTLEIARREDGALLDAITILK